MPYIVVTGSLCTPHLTKDDETVIYGLDRHERSLFTEELNTSFKGIVATASDSDRTVKIHKKGLTLVVVNRLHASLGYDVISHSMAMTNTNRELLSWTMYKKTGSSHANNPAMTSRQITANITI